MDFTEAIGDIAMQPISPLVINIDRVSEAHNTLLNSGQSIQESDLSKYIQILGGMDNILRHILSTNNLYNLSQPQLNGIMQLLSATPNTQLSEPQKIACNTPETDNDNKEAKVIVYSKQLTSYETVNAIHHNLESPSNKEYETIYISKSNTLLHYISIWETRMEVI